ncbi:oxidoreductase AflX [Cladorrhinum sp. PSN259]|nr:oxidoreductase AflX [Cladorrhinum sp. PSN259]
MSSSTSSPKTILVLGATGGVAFSALNRSLAAGHACVALARNPSTLSAKFPNSTPPPNLHIVEGNAHSISDLTRCLTLLATPVTHIISSIGSLPSMSSGFALADPQVCEKGMSALVAAISAARSSHESLKAWSPRIVAVSSTGLSSVQRDIPLPYVPLYHGLLRQAHKDKKKMEDLLIASGEEDWTIIRGSLYIEGKAPAEGSKQKVIRAGKEDPVGMVVERKELGYTISRADVGRWIFEELVQEGQGQYEWKRRVANITY